MTSRGHRLGRFVIGGLLSAASTAGTVVATSSRAAAATELRLIEHTFMVPAGGTYRLVVAATDIAPTANVSVSVLPVISNDDELRSAIDRRVDAKAPRQTIGGRATHYLNLDGNLELIFATSVTVQRDAIRLERTGVYPVHVVITDQGRPRAELVTFITRVDAALTEPLRFATVVTLDGGPALRPDGSVHVVDTVRRDAAVARAAAPLTRLTLAVRPELVQALAMSSSADDRRLATDLANVASTGEVVADTFVAIDPSRAFAEGLDGEYRRQLSLGAAAIQGWLGTAWSDRGVRIAPSVATAAAIELITATGGHALVTPLSPGYAVNLPGFTPVTDRSAGLTTVATDPLLREILRSAGADAVVVDDRMVAYLAHRALDPSPTVHGLAVVWETGIDPSAFSAVERAVLSLSASPNAIVRPVPISELLTIPHAPSRDIIRLIPDSQPAGAAAIGARLATVRLDLAVLGSMVTNTPGDPDPALTRAASTSLSNDERDEYVRRSTAAWEPLRTAVRTVPRPRLTLTSTRTRLPLALESDLDQDVAVTIRISGGKLKQTVVEQAVVHQGVWRGNVPIEVLEGRSEVRVDVLAPLGDTVISTETIDVQVFALSGIGSLLSVGALLVLGSWWIAHHRRIRSIRQRDAHIGHHGLSSAPIEPMIEPMIEPIEHRPLRPLPEAADEGGVILRTELGSDA